MTENTQPPFADGPFLEVACICEQVLVEGDGLKSAIRIMDRLNHSVSGPNPPEEMEPFEWEAKLLIKFKSGRARGPLNLQLTLEKPSGVMPPITRMLNFEGEDDRGVDIITNLKIRFDTPGLHWINVALNDVRVTRLPLRLVYLPQIIKIPGQGQGPPLGEEEDQD